MKRYLLGIALMLTLLTGVFSVIGAPITFAYTESSTVGEDVDLSTERITNYDSQIEVRTDGSMQVTETVTVIANNETIRHGIYRDFPTTYRDKNGNRYIVGFEVSAVERDGHSEPFRIESLSNGKRIRIGSADTILNPGIYTYTIHYTTTRQLGYFTDHDELYWNVTGNGWNYAIEHASASVRLPANIPLTAVTTYGYTGAQNAKGTAYEAVVNDTRIDFKTTESLKAEEGLTIVVGWPKGYVHEPTQQEKWNYFVSDNRDIWFAIGLSVLLFIFYFILWSRFGRDPKPESIIAQYESPRGLSPAEVHYQNEMGYSKKAFTAAILNMAVKGYLVINEAKGALGFGKVYTLQKTGKDVILSADEQAVSQALFVAGDSIEMVQGNYRTFQLGETGLKKILKDNLANGFVLNIDKIVIGSIGSIITIILGCFTLFDSDSLIIGVVFVCVWLAVWTSAVGMLVSRVVSEFGGKRIGSGSVLLLFAIPFIAAEIFVFGMLFYMTSLVFSIFLLVVLVISAVFIRIMKRRTLEGQKLQDEVEGFKLFLSMTEKDRLNFHNPPEKTPELFEKFLPYALALGVEHVWAEQFAEVFARIAQSGQTGYSPAWYHGAAFSASNIGGFTSGLSGSLSSAVSSASASPGSSSGGGGGGSSGGGGGGGGGGGW